MPGIWETEAEWRRLKRELAAWRLHRRQQDPAGQHCSQLEGCVSLIDVALQELHGPIATMCAADPRVVAQCRVHDRRLAWLRRAWEFFRERFDQRDDETLAPTLRAADEIVWSCHREPFEGILGQGTSSSGPPPLPYIEAQVSPEVYPRGLVPGALRRDVDAAFLQSTLDALPFAVVRVPAASVTAPWWLVHLGHETGHVVDDQLLGFEARSRIVDTLALTPAAADEWGRWSGELFADLYAVLMFGPWALWALTTAEARDDAAMLAPRDLYPPAAVRLLVARHACRALGHGTDVVDDAAAGWQSLVSTDSQQVDRVRDGARVVDAFLASPVGQATWVARTAHEPARWTSVALQAWATRLPGRPATMPGKPRRRWVREVLAAAVMRRRQAESTVSGFDGEALAGDVLEWLPVVREPGARHSATAAFGGAAARGVTLARALMAAEPVP